MNEPSSASRTPFIIILILLLAITGVQYFFNFNGLGTDAAMDHAQIARNVARGQGMTTNWLRPIQMVSGSTRAGLNPFLSDAQIHEQEAIRAGQGETLVDPEKFNPYALRDTRNAPLNILTEAAVFRMAGVHKFDLWNFIINKKLQFFFYKFNIPEPELLIYGRKTVTAGKWTSPAALIINNAVFKLRKVAVCKRNFT